MNTPLDIGNENAIGIFIMNNSPLKKLTNTIWAFDEERLSDSTLSGFLKTIVNSCEKYLLEFYPDTPVSVTKKGLISSQFSDQNDVVFVIWLNDAGSNVSAEVLGDARAFLSEFVRSVLDFSDLFQGEKLCELTGAEKRNFLDVETARFIQKNSNKRVSSPLTLQVPGEESYETPIQGRFRGGALQEIKTEPFVGMAKSDGARGSHNVVYLWLYDESYRPVSRDSIPVLVCSEPHARLASYAHAESPYLLQIEAHKTIDANERETWHLDSAELMSQDMLDEFKLEE